MTYNYLRQWIMTINWHWRVKINILDRYELTIIGTICTDIVCNCECTTHPRQCAGMLCVCVFVCDCVWLWAHARTYTRTRASSCLRMRIFVRMWVSEYACVYVYERVVYESVLDCLFEDVCARTHARRTRVCVYKLIHLRLFNWQRNR